MSRDEPWRVFHIGGGETDDDVTTEVVGLKAANLARLDRRGLRVPPALALTTDLFREWQRQGRRLPERLSARLAGSLRWLEEMTGLTFGGTRPLLLSVRPSPLTSMPGVLDSILNVGLSETTVRGLIRRTGNAALAWDCYRRLVRSFGEGCYGLPPAAFDGLVTAHLVRAGVHTCDELDPMALRDLARESADLLRVLTGEVIPHDPMAQVSRAVEAVLASWNAPHAREYRHSHGIADDEGTAVLIQAMVFGNAGAGSGSGVGFTHNPSTGEGEVYFDFVFNAQGPEIVSEHHAPCDNALSRMLPEVWLELQASRSALEREFGDMQAFEFTIENGRLYFLQTRDGSPTPWAAARIAVDLVAAGVIDGRTALQRVGRYDPAELTRFSVSAAATQPLARGIGVSVGVATGAVVFDAARARQLVATEPVILVRDELDSDDFALVAGSAGIVTRYGGRTSPAAVVARQLGTVALVGCNDLHVDTVAHTCVLGASRLREGDVITIDGETGLIYAGRVDIVAQRSREVETAIQSWRAAVAPPVAVDAAQPAAVAPPPDAAVSSALAADAP